MKTDVNHEKSENRSIVEILCVTALGIFIIFGILVAAGTLTSGYHFADDHEVARMEYYLEVSHQSVWNVMSQNIIGDMWRRFRPFYWVERTICAAIFGCNMLYWNIYTGIKGVLAFLFLYLIARNLENNPLCSILFSGIIIIGQQFTPFYRSANQENTGLLVCAFTLWIISRQYRKGVFNGIFDNVLICAGAIIAGLIKESFLVFMPVFIMVKYWLEYCSIGESEGAAPGVFRVLKNNILTYGVIAVAFICDICYMLLRVGVGNVSYAGFHAGTTLHDYIKYIYENLFYYTRDYTYFALLIVIMMIMSHDWTKRPEFNGKLRVYTGLSIISLFGMGVELVSYAYSRIWERYLFPYLITYAFITVLAGYSFFSGKKVQKWIFSFLLLLMICRQFPEGYDRALSYAEEGHNVQSILEDVVENAEKDSRIVTAFTITELNVSMESMLENMGYTNVMTYNYDGGGLENLIQLAQMTAENMQMADADIVICYNAQGEELLEAMGLNEADARAVYDFGGYEVIVR